MEGNNLLKQNWTAYYLFLNNIWKSTVQKPKYCFGKVTIATNKRHPTKPKISLLLSSSTPLLLF